MLESLSHGARANYRIIAGRVAKESRGSDNLPPRESAWGPWQQSQHKTLSRMVVSYVLGSVAWFWARADMPRKAAEKGRTYC